MLRKTTLSSVGSTFVYLTSTLVHPAFFPYPLAATLHAARVSIAYQNNVCATKSGSSLTWGVYLAGYLIMAWGGGLASHILMGLPPPQLYSLDPYINYLTVHLALTAFFRVFPAALQTKTLDTVCFPLDALLRVNSITSSLALLSLPDQPGSAPGVDPKLRSSVLFHLIIGCVASSGGGVTGATLGVWRNEWSVGTPVFLRGAGILGTLDVWTGGLAALMYNLLTLQNEAYVGASALVTPYLPQSFTILDGQMPAKTISLAPFTPLDAKSTTAIMLAAFYAWRVYYVHWAEFVPMRSRTPNATTASKKFAQRKR